MEVKSNSDCLNRVDNMIFERSLKCTVKDDLEDIKKHIENKQMPFLEGSLLKRGKLFCPFSLKLFT